MRIPTAKYPVLLIAAILVLFLLAGSRAITNTNRARLTDWLAGAIAAPKNAFQAVSRLMPFTALREENRKLRGIIDEQARRLGEARAVYDENERLKDLLGFRKDLPFSTVPARVIGRDPSNWSNSLIIDKGSDGGVAANKAVISAKGVVGRVVELGRRSARVLLITDPNSKVGVVVGRNRQGGILLGRSDGTCKMIYISLDSDVVSGDEVVTSGLGSAFPKNIPVGKIVSVGKEPGRLYKFAVVRPADDLSKIEEVLCVK